MRTLFSPYGEADNFDFRSEFEKLHYQHQHTNNLHTNSLPGFSPGILPLAHWEDVLSTAQTLPFLAQSVVSARLEHGIDSGGVNSPIAQSSFPAIGVLQSTDSVLDKTSTNASLTMNGTINNAIEGVPEAGSSNTAVDHDWFQVSLAAGQTYTFGAAVTSGLTTDYLDSVAIDLKSPTGTTIANTLDDSVAPTFTYTPSTSGIYFLAISAGGNDTASQTFDYSISVLQNGVTPGSGVVDPFVPYTDQNSGSPTPADVVAAALQYQGKLWAWENCTGLVWAIGTETGGAFYNTIQTITGQTTIPSIVPDPLAGDPHGYVTPTSGTYGNWTTVQTSDWTHYVQAGDIVRIPGSQLANDPAGHSFVVVGKDGSGHWEVIDNTDPNHVSGQINSDRPVTITEHTFNTGNTLYTEVLDASVAYVSRLNTTPVNHAPVANNDSYSMSENTVLSISVPGLLSNDTDADGNSLTASRYTNPSHGSITVYSDGSFYYTPAFGYSGTDSFTYWANDGTVDSTNPATVSLTINAPPDDLLANSSTTGVVTPGGSQALGTIEVAGDRDWFKVQVVQGDTYTVNLDSGSPPQLGPFLSDPEVYLYNSSSQLISSNDDFGGTPNSQLTFTAAYTGSYFIGAGAYNDSGTGTYRVTVSPGADVQPPQLVNDGTLSIVKAGGSGQITSSLLEFTDNVSPDSQETYTLMSGPNHGTVLKSGIATEIFTQQDIDDGKITYQNNGDGATSDSFGFWVTDNAQNQTAIKYFNFNIPAPPPPPDLTANTLGFANTTLSFHINNVGTASASASTAGIYLSTDSTITTADTRINTHATPALAAGASDIESVVMTLPTGLTPGTYYIGVIADYLGGVAESNEGNNASTGTPIILGNDSANTLTGTAGADKMFALGGNDTIYMYGNLTSADQIDGGSGTDTLSYNGDYSAGLTLGATTIVNVETFYFAPGHSYKLTTNDANVASGQTLTVNGGGLTASDSLTFNGAPETNGQFTVYGGAGNDTITTGSGNDNISGGAGNDVITPGAGNDIVSGGADNDTIYVYANLTAADRIDGGVGTDIVSFNGDYSLGLTLGANTIVNVETFYFAPGHSYKLTTNDANVASGQTLTVNGGSLTASDSLTFNGSPETNGQFTVYGGAGNDTITTGSGNDNISGGGGNDVITPGAGNDIVSGGANNDTIYMYGNLTSADQIDGGSGTDTVSYNGDYSLGLTLGANTIVNVETFYFAPGHSYKLTTNDANVASGQTLTVNGGGLTASDSLTFNGSSETNGQFTVYGGAGNDTITGGNGADAITGGAGADTFVYSSATQSTSTKYDTLAGVDFNADHFDTPGAPGTVTGIDAALTSGALSTASFDNDLATALNGHLNAHHAELFKANSGTLSGQTFLIVDLNGTAGYQAGEDLVIHLTGQAGALAMGDFI